MRLSTAGVRREPYGGQVAKKYREVRQALSDAGWTVVRQRGSHEVWAHPDRRERVVVAGKDSDTVPTGTLGSIRRATGLENLR
jgi:predicted RNA binding protein YcfA (HicA-like mRNA interferase family)